MSSLSPKYAFWFWKVKLSFVPKKGELTNFNMNTETTVPTAVEKSEISSERNLFEYTTTAKKRFFNIILSVSGTDTKHRTVSG